VSLSRAPINCDSGKQRGTRHISGVRQSVRNALYMATLSARTWNPTIRALAQRLSATGKPFKVVMTACMRGAENNTAAAPQPT
jgi:transposase